MAFVDDAADAGTNYERALAHRPDVYAAWQRLNAAIKESLDLRRYELVTLAAARRLRSSYCALAHGSVLLDRFVDADELRALALDRDAAGLDAADAAAMAFAEKLVDDATSVTRDDVERLRAAGLDDGEIVSVAAAAAARCFFSKLLDALGCEPDASYAELDPELRDALVVGRPIAAS
jgi:uncharacterized peroxidase-related enzyme